MIATRKLIQRTLILLAVFYLFICLCLYFFQEKFIFFPEKLNKNFRFSFGQTFREVNVKAKDGTNLSALLFTVPNSKGLIFYLHGNAGSLASWGDVAKTYTGLQYDVFMLDYRGYGKSEGTIKNQTEFYDDVRIAYNVLKELYHQDNIVVLGYSLGTGPAAYIASTNRPKMLILQAPYFNLTDMMKHIYPIIPTFLLKYKFETNEHLKRCKSPIVLFHGDKDEVIYYGSSKKLKQYLKPGDMLITLKGQGHNGITENPDYKRTLGEILSK